MYKSAVLILLLIGNATHSANEHADKQIWSHMTLVLNHIAYITAQNMDDYSLHTYLQEQRASNNTLFQEINIKPCKKATVSDALSIAIEAGNTVIEMGVEHQEIALCLLTAERIKKQLVGLGVQELLSKEQRSHAVTQVTQNLVSQYFE